MSKEVAPAPDVPADYKSANHNVLSMFDLTGKKALVTGGTGWLGKAFCEALAEANCSIIVSSRSRERAQQAAAALPSPADQTHFGIELDHMDEESLKKGFSEALEVAGGVDILINNGLEGIELAQGSKLDIASTTFEQFSRHQTNNAGYFSLARCLRDHVVSINSTGSVINIGSMYGQVASYPDAYEGLPYSSPVAYHALKGGTLHLTRHLAAYWAADGVRVNSLSPGAFPSASAPQDLVTRLKTKLPMKRMGKPHELKGMLLLLASDAGSYMTGQNFNVDGGWMCW